MLGFRRLAQPRAVLLVAVAMPLLGVLHASAAAAGNTWGWGANFDYFESRIGNGDTTNRVTTPPVHVSLPPGVVFTSVALSGGGGAAVDTTGALWTWGHADELGRGTRVGNTNVPARVPVAGGVTFRSVVAGQALFAALDSGGRAWMWGRAGGSAVFGRGQGGTGQAVQSTPAPVLMPPGITFTGVAPGADFVLAIDQSGRLFGWGSNGQGQLGNGSIDPAGTQPAQWLDRPQPGVTPHGVSFTQVAAGSDAGLAVDSAGELWYTGLEHSQTAYQANVNDTTPRLVPVAGAHFTRVAVGLGFALGLSSSGVAYGWGNDTSGQLGAAPTLDMSRFGQGSFSPEPTPVAAPRGVVFTAIAAAQASAAAVDTQGRVWAWGSNQEGELGTGSRTPGQSITPVPVGFPSGVTLTDVTSSAFALTIAAFAAPAPAAAASNLSTFSTSLLSPLDAFTPLTTTVVSGAVTGGAVLFLTFPANLFNLTLQENYAEISGLLLRPLRPLRRLVRRRGGAPNPVRRGAMAGFAAVVLGGAALGDLNDPTFGSRAASLATYAATVLSVLLGITVAASVTALYHRTRHGSAEWAPHALPLGLVIAAMCVAISRLSGFQPGYLYGVVASVVFLRRLPRHENAHIVAITATATLVTAVIAWFAWVPVHHAAQQAGAAAPLIVLDGVLATTFVGGLVGTVINLLPLRFLPGATLQEWRRDAWAVVFVVAFFLLVQVMLRPHGSSPSNTPLLTTVGLFIAFGVLSVGLREVFARRRRGGGGAGPSLGERVREVLSPAPESVTPMTAQPNEDA
ncbi:MAG: FGLLP motif-containing membrane protein [Candidatus Dormibacteria bacterium]